LDNSRFNILYLIYRLNHKLFDQDKIVYAQLKEIQDSHMQGIWTPKNCDVHRQKLIIKGKC